MPNIQPTLSYIRKLRIQEQKYLIDIKAARADFRRVALDILTRYGVKMSIIQDIRRELYALEQQVTTAGRQNSAQVDEILVWHMNQQLGNLRKAGETGLPTVQQVNLDTYSQRQQLYQSTMQASPAWVSDLARSMELNISRLSITGADPQAAISRLLSTGIVDGRASIFRVSEAAAITETRTTTWTAASALMAAMYMHTSHVTKVEYSHQAIAAIDQNTTNCCLLVHGQIQPLDKPFILYGTPRFADKMDNSPFHWNCRTAISLYTQRMEAVGITTQEMRDAAEAEAKARAEGSTAKTWPVNSVSKRGE